MKFQLEIELGNAAMRTSRDVAYALRSTASAVQQMFDGLSYGVSAVKIRDTNGNTVGKWLVAPDRDISPDPEEMNRKRAAAALDTIRYFGSRHGERGLDQQNLTDLLADLGHACEAEGMNLHSSLVSAKNHYSEETDRKGTQFAFLDHAPRGWDSVSGATDAAEPDYEDPNDREDGYQLGDDPH